MSHSKIFGSIKRAMRQAMVANKLNWSSEQLNEHLQASFNSKLNSRRDFIKHSATVAAMTPIISKLPATLFRDPASIAKSKADPVLILGGGPAGLAAAYTLKKAGVPFKILEASLRTGGRIHTQFKFTTDGQFIERGAELVDSAHETLIDLASEVGLEIEDFTASDAGLESELYYFGGKIYTHLDLVNAVGPLVKAIVDAKAVGARAISFRDAKKDQSAAHWDSLTIAELLTTFRGKCEDWVIDAIGVAYLGEAGRELEEQSALNLIGEIDTDLSNGFNMFGESDETKRIKGGNSLLPLRLQELVSHDSEGVIEFGAKVVAIHEKGSKIKVTVSKHGGHTKEYLASQVICTIPFSVLREVSGLEKLELQPEKLRAIMELGYGQNSKTMLEFNDRLWRSQGELAQASTGSVYGDFESQAFWETSRLQPGKYGILTNFRGGHAAVKASRDTVKDSLRDIAKLHPKLAHSFVKGVVMNWNFVPTAKGSYTCFLPGQYTIFNGVLGEAEMKGRLLFAGEHCSEEFLGFMNGAYETGIDAANEIVKSRGLSLYDKVSRSKKGA
jgi:monoamine oxidase